MKRSLEQTKENVEYPQVAPENTKNGTIKKEHRESDKYINLDYLKIESFLEKFDAEIRSEYTSKFPPSGERKKKAEITIMDRINNILPLPHE